MALALEGKKAIVAEVQEVISTSYSAVTAEYRGLTVAEMTALRQKARDAGVTLKVVRNTLAKRAVEGTDFACIQDTFTGPLVYAFSHDAPGTAARLFKDFLKETGTDKLIVNSIAVGENAYGAESLDAVAALPTKDEALASLMMVMNGPVTKLARTLNEIPSKITRVIAAVKDQKAA
jgi:large subunit ribosomal protein L10